MTTEKARVLKPVSYGGIRFVPGTPGRDVISAPSGLIARLIADGSAEPLCGGACPFPAPADGDVDDEPAPEVDEPKHRGRRKAPVEETE
jgi:hypothetical protein